MHRSTYFTFGDETPSYAIVKRWYNEFNRGRHSITDEFTNFFFFFSFIRV